MKRLGQTVFALCLFCAGLTIIAMLCGRAQRPSAAVQAYSFDHCGGAICFKGIIPGLTSTRETLTLLSKFTGTRIDSLPIGVPVGGDGLVSIFIKVLITQSNDTEDRGALSEPQPVTVGPILLTRRNGKALFSVGWIVAQYGAPCRITVNPTGYDFVLRYPTLIVQVKLPLYGERRLSPESPATSMMLNEDGDSAQCSNTDPPWIGFASVARYLDMDN